MDKKKGIVIGAAALVLVTSLFSSSPKKEETSEATGTSALSINQLLGNATEIQEEVLEEGSASKRILVIPIEGEIGTTGSTYNHDLILSSIDQIREDPTIMAVLLSIDSPGGGVYATREVYDRMKEIQAEIEIPVYASMGSTAASGGYYLSMLGDKVFASEETITGSIGVIMSSYNTQDLLEKLGVKPVVIKSADMKDIMSTSRDMTDAERQVLQTYIDESFQRFVDVVEEGRGMSEEEVRKLADGRIYSGSQALQAGLVDEMGYEKDALAALKSDFDLTDAQVFTYTSNDLGFGSFFPSLLGQLGLSSDTTPLGQMDKMIEKIESLDDMKLEYKLQGGY
ncbi:signal peptide peptidase SppA [Streptococcus caprae]|uniref:Signal peptide peptidase SppA n=1 Tax=Streptococcus caprae TaxID=1640501 RepID=A0ABV8CWI6_9STRE